MGNKIHTVCSFKHNNHFSCVKSGWGNSRADNSISTRNHKWHHWFSYTADNDCNFGIGPSLLTEMDYKLPLTALIFAVLLGYKALTMAKALMHYDVYVPITCLSSYGYNVLPYAVISSPYLDKLILISRE